MGRPFPPQNCPCTCGILWSTLLSLPNGISIGSAISAGLMITTDRPANRLSVAIMSPTKMGEPIEMPLQYCIDAAYCYRWSNVTLSVKPHLHDTTGCQTCCTTGLTSNRLSNWLSSNRLSKRLSKWFDNRLNVCIHNTAGCQTSCQTGLTTVLNEQHCSFNRLSNPVGLTTG